MIVVFEVLAYMLILVLDKLMPSEEYCYSMELERGDIQLLNNFVIWHSRTSFEDY